MYDPLGEQNYIRPKIEVKDALNIWHTSSNFIAGEELKIAVFDTGETDEPGIEVKDTSNVDEFIKVCNAVYPNAYTDAFRRSEKKARYLSPQGNECKIIRTTENTVTLLIYDNLEDPHEWTTTIENFTKNYKAIS